MDGTPSETWRFIEPLAVRLRKAWPDKEVVFHDERFTSVMAHRTMLESGIGKMARRDKALVDKISATIIYRVIWSLTNDLSDSNLWFGRAAQALRADHARLSRGEETRGRHVPDARRSRGRRAGSTADRQEYPPFIVDCTPWGEDDPECADYKRAFINPEIYALSEEKKTYNEGCLSFPGIHADVPRSLAIRMRYMDEDFVEHDEEFHGLKAWVIQHEYDHIEGIVFTDRISPLRRNLLKGKLMNLAKGKYRCAYKTK